jgi:hypothetical protein
MLLKPAPYSIRLEVAITEILILPAPFRSSVDVVEKGPNPFRCLARHPERVAQLAGAVPVMQRVGRGREELHILALRLSGAAREAAEDARRDDADDANAVELTVSVDERLVEDVSGRQLAGSRSVAHGVTVSFDVLLYGRRARPFGQPETLEGFRRTHERHHAPWVLPRRDLQLRHAWNGRRG